MKPILNRYGPVQTCIYCGRSGNATKLGKEHIVPLSLGGKLVLPRASCSKCASTISTFERICAKQMFGHLRASLKMPTRRPQEQQNQKLELVLHEKGNDRAILVAAADYPYITLMMPQLDLSHWMAGRASGTSNKAQWRTFHAQKHPGPALPGGPPEISTGVIRIDMTAFYLLLAKIAHGFAVAEEGLDTHTWLLPPLILRHQTNFSDVIGGATPLVPVGHHMGPQNGRTKLQGRHQLELREVVAATGNRCFLAVDIRLLFDFTPLYRVLVAELPSPRRPTVFR